MKLETPPASPKIKGLPLLSLITSPFLFFKTASGVMFGGESSIFWGPLLVCMVYDVPATFGIIIVCGFGVFSKKNSFGLLVSARFAKTVIRGGETVSCFTVSGFWFSCSGFPVVVSELFEQEEYKNNTVIKRTD